MRKTINTNKKINKSPPYSLSKVLATINVALPNNKPKRFWIQW